MAVRSVREIGKREQRDEHVERERERALFLLSLFGRIHQEELGDYSFFTCIINSYLD